MFTPECQTPSHTARAKSTATIRAYSSDWRDFLRWTEQHGLVPLPATDETVALYLAHLAAQGLRPATLGRRLVAISQAHKGADEPTPTTSSAVRRVYAGIRRTHGTAQRAKTPAL